MHNHYPRIVLLIFILFSCNILFAQPDTVTYADETTSNRISVEFGFSTGYLKDLNFSPLNYSEWGSVFSVSYIRKKPEGRNGY